MPGELTVAIAGAGLMGSWHARYARQCGATICGVADPDVQAASRLNSKHPGSREFRSIEQLIRECRPQVVHICTPTKTHVPIAQAALESGAHVISEKPLAPDAAATQELLSLAASKSRLILPVHQFLFQDGFRKAQAALGTLGRILFVETLICSAGGEHASANMGDIAAEILPHPLSLIERLTPGILDELQWNVGAPLPGEWMISSHGRGLSVSILISLLTRPTEASMRVGTERGLIDLDLFHGFGMIDKAPVSKAAKIGRPFRRSAHQFGCASWNLSHRLVTREFAYPGLRTLFSQFYGAVRNGARTPMSAAEILAVAAARDRIVQSTKQKREGL